MFSNLSQRITRIKPSPTLAVSTKAAQLKRQGIDVIDLGVGEPDFDTPLHIKEAAIAAINQGQTKYTAVDGTFELKTAIQKRVKLDNKINYDLDQILVSSGAKQSLYNLFQVLLEKDDEVLIPAPYWVSYPDMVALTDAIPISLPTSFEQGFKITPEQLKNSITSKTKLLILNSPSNPSGQIYSREELKAFAEVLYKYPKVHVVTDDIYAKILWSLEPFANIAMVAADLVDRTIIIDGVSKAYSMTGWRIGYALGPKKIIQAMNKLQSQSTSCACSISQAAAIAALNGPQNSITNMALAFAKRHTYIYNALNSIPGIKAIASQGSFYSFFNIEELLNKPSFYGKSDVEFAEHLLAHKVALVPGSAFGCPGNLRLSFATSEEQLQLAIRRITQAIS